VVIHYRDKCLYEYEIGIPYGRTALTSSLGSPPLMWKGLGGPGYVFFVFVSEWNQTYYLGRWSQGESLRVRIICEAY